MVEIAKPFMKFLGDIVVEHLENEEDEDKTPDFCYAYLKEVRNSSDPGSSFYKERGGRLHTWVISADITQLQGQGRCSYFLLHYITVKCLPIILLDMYGAGSGTTTSTLAWVILYLLRHPEVQTRLQKELDEVTGGSRAPCLADRPK